jgi:apolipoprotein D and lipocalin family protein
MSTTRAWVALLCSFLMVPALPAAATDSGGKVVRVGISHYRGTWLEIARRPMFITDGCVAGYTTYKPTSNQAVIAVEDGCYKGTPDGSLRNVHAYGRIEDFGSTNARLTVNYPFFITFKYWVRYQSPDRSWFISADPDMKNLWIYARYVPSKRQLAVMVAKAKSLGYDVSKLEFPAQ